MLKEMAEMTTQPIITVQRNMSKGIAFLAGEDDAHVYILDNFVWAVHSKPIPKKEFADNFKRVTVGEDRVQKILVSLKNYAILAGCTPEGMDVLKRWTPVTKDEERVALDKGYATLARHKTQAAAEKAADGMKVLAGAALSSKVKQIMAKEVMNDDGTVDHEKLAKVMAGDEPKPSIQEAAEELVEPSTGNSATESGETTGEVAETETKTTRKGRRTQTAKAKKIQTLVDEVSETLTEVEKAGGNPAQALKVAGTAKAKLVEGFDPAKLKGKDGQYKSVSAMMKGLILEGKLNDDQIFKAVQKKFGIGDDKKGYVKWNRNWLKKEGIIEA